MEYGFRDWFACPGCGDRESIGTLAHETEIVFECHECGQRSEYVIGEDVPLQGLDIDAIAADAEETTSD